MFDVLIIGGGVSGVSCALVLGSANAKPFVASKKIGIVMHQKTSALQEALLKNVYGIAAGSLGADVLASSNKHLQESYPHIDQIHHEKVLKVEGYLGNFIITTNKNTFTSKMIAIGIGSANTFAVEGLLDYIIPHQKALPEKQRIQLKNLDHKVADGIYVMGTLAGWPSQVAIAAGSGAAVATDILTLWNDGVASHAHDSTR